MEKKKTIKVLCIALAFLIVGIIIIVLNKFTFNVNYSKNVRLEIDLQQDFDIGDVVGITNEIYEGQIPIIRKGGNFSELLTITVKESTDEQNEELINKINEKFEKEYTKDDIKVYYNSNVKGMDLVKPFIATGIIATIFILVFFGIRYKKLGIVKTILSVLLTMVGATILYAALTSLFGMEINEGTMSIGVAIEIFCITYMSKTLEKELEKK